MAYVVESKHSFFREGILAISVVEFEKALSQLETALAMHEAENDPVTKAVIRDAVIQRFEFCVELSWKSALKKLGLPAQAPKPAVRELALAGLIADIQDWFSFIEARNKSSHTYSEAVAHEVMAVMPMFVLQAKSLLQKLKS
jgi:nucleotidyltransferase substrate binding protein (TIGR01987 family)